MTGHKLRVPLVSSNPKVIHGAGCSVSINIHHFVFMFGEFHIIIGDSAIIFGVIILVKIIRVFY